MCVAGHAGRWMPLAVVYHKDYESAKRTFLIYHQLSFARGFIYLLLMVLPFFEVSDTAFNEAEPRVFL